MIDSERVLLVHRPGRPPVYAFPAGDVGTGRQTVPEPDTPGYVTVEWDGVDAWFEEDEEVFGHPRNPYHRVDCLRSGRRLRVEANGVTLVDCASTLVVYETALEPRLYVEPSYVRMDLLQPSETHSYCPYKGTASYWTRSNRERDGRPMSPGAIEDPLPESSPLGGFLSFDETRVTVQHDLPAPAEGQGARNRAPLTWCRAGCLLRSARSTRENQWWTRRSRHFSTRRRTVSPSSRSTDQRCTTPSTTPCSESCRTSGPPSAHTTT